MSKREESKKTRKPLRKIFVLGMILFGIFMLVLIGMTIREVMLKSNERNALNSEISKEYYQNQVLKNQKTSGMNNVEIEDSARRDFNYLKPGEKIVVLDDIKK